MVGTNYDFYLNNLSFTNKHNIYWKLNVLVTQKESLNDEIFVYFLRVGTFVTEKSIFFAFESPPCHTIRRVTLF